MEEAKFLVLTIICELPVAILFLRKEDWRQVVLLTVGVNMVSHPIVWQAIYSFHVHWWFAEVCVASFEGAVFATVFQKRRWFAGYTGVMMNIFTAGISRFF